LLDNRPSSEVLFKSAQLNLLDSNARQIWHRN
jgi:hypothetical protein